MFTKSKAEQQLGTIKLGFFYFIALVLYLLSTSSKGVLQKVILNLQAILKLKK